MERKKTIALHALLGFLGLFTCFASKVQAQSSLKVVQTWVLPQEVVLGQPFLYRVRVRLRPGTRLSLAAPSRLGVAQILQAPITKRLPTDPSIVQMDLKLAIFQVRTFGLRSLPALKVRVHPAREAPKDSTLPPVKVEVIARYGSTRRFRLQQDPAVVLPPALTQPGGPSHEWRVMGQIARDPSQQKKPWDPLMLAALAFCGLAMLLFGVGLWMSRKRQQSKQSEAMPPYQVALLQLQRLTFPLSPTAESTQLYYRQGEQILRVYLQNRLSCPLLHLTGREIPKTLEKHTDPMFQLPREWWDKLRYLLDESETFCYGPEPPRPSAGNLPHKLRSLIEPVENQMKAIEAQEENRR